MRQMQCLCQLFCHLRIEPVAIRALPLEPMKSMGYAEAKPTSASLQLIEAAVLQLLAAVRQAGQVSCPNQIPSPVAAPSQGRSLSTSTAPKTLATVANEFLAAKARANRSDSYLRNMRTSLGQFALGREGRVLATLTAEEIETWLYSHGWQPRTVKNNLMAIRTLLAWSVTRGELVANVAMGIDMPTMENEPPEIHTPAEVRAVLEKAREIDLPTMRYMAVRYFAGLRSSEAAALEEKEIGETYIEVTARKAKTRRRRLVEIQPCLRAWLAVGGTLPLRQVNNRVRALTSALAVPWPKNAPRHSFCSYHLAKYQSAAKTALEAGHTEQMLFAHYRALVTPAQAEEFFSILPRIRSNRQ
jgi:integrase